MENKTLYCAMLNFAYLLRCLYEKKLPNNLHGACKNCRIRPKHVFEFECREIHEEIYKMAAGIGVNISDAISNPEVDYQLHVDK